MNYNIILFGLLAIIFIVIITLSIKLIGLQRKRLLPCDNTSSKTNIDIIDEYQENINDITQLSVSSKPKKIKFNNIVQVRVFG